MMYVGMPFSEVWQKDKDAVLNGILNRALADAIERHERESIRLHEHYIRRWRARQHKP